MERESHSGEGEPPDLQNEDVLKRILEEGSDTELEEVRIFHHWSESSVARYRYYAQLRKETVAAGGAAVADREEQHPQASEAELNLGAYAEAIEPQVRAAIFHLREKGYVTMLSGFANFDGQSIRFIRNELERYTASSQLVEFLEKRGIILCVRPNEISFSCKDELSLSQLESIWQHIEADLPDKGKPASPSLTRAAQTFRKKQAKRGE